MVPAGAGGFAELVEIEPVAVEPVLLPLTVLLPLLVFVLGVSPSWPRRPNRSPGMAARSAS